MLNLRKGIFGICAMCITLLCSVFDIMFIGFLVNKGVDSELLFLIATIWSLRMIAYVLAYVITYIISKKSKSGAIQNGESVTFKGVFQEIGGKPTVGEVTVPVCDIIEITYLRCSSPLACLAFLMYLYIPNSAILRYVSEGTEKELLIGYPTYKELKQFCEQAGIKLKKYRIR